MSYLVVPTRINTSTAKLADDFAQLQANLTAMLSGEAPWTPIDTPVVFPATDTYFLYFKSDGKLYKMDDAGSETCLEPFTIRLLMGGGGGSGGSWGGGGGGEVVELSDVVFPDAHGTEYFVTIGAGGAQYAASAWGTPGNNGSDTVLEKISGGGTFTTKTAKGGGGGGGHDLGTGARGKGNDGGCGGGGGSGENANAPFAGGASTASDGVGFDGGDGTGRGSSNSYPSAGGGGAGEEGHASEDPNSGSGGDGIESAITGDTLYWGGGGGGYGYNGVAGHGGKGGGAGGCTQNGVVGNSDQTYGYNDASQPVKNTTNGDGGANTGGGGGGGGGPALQSYSGGNGGSGFLVIRYTSATQKFTGGDDVFQDGADWVHVFTQTQGWEM